MPGTPAGRWIPVLPALLPGERCPAGAPREQEQEIGRCWSGVVGVVWGSRRRTPASTGTDPTFAFSSSILSLSSIQRWFALDKFSIVSPSSFSSSSILFVAATSSCAVASPPPRAVFLRAVPPSSCCIAFACTFSAPPPSPREVDREEDPSAHCFLSFANCALSFAVISFVR